LRLAEIDRLRTELYRASPSLRTRTLLHRARSVTAEVQRWSLRPGQLVIVDEASMAGTFELDTLTEQARTAGAKVLLVGDWAQLSPVSAGGAFHLLATDRHDAPQLHDVRRFRHESGKAPRRLTCATVAPTQLTRTPNTVAWRAVTGSPCST